MTTCAKPKPVAYKKEYTNNPGTGLDRQLPSDGYEQFTFFSRLFLPALHCSLDARQTPIHHGSILVI